MIKKCLCGVNYDTTNKEEKDKHSRSSIHYRYLNRMKSDILKVETCEDIDDQKDMYKISQYMYNTTFKDNLKDRLKYLKWYDIGYMEQNYINSLLEKEYHDYKYVEYVIIETKEWITHENVGGSIIKYRNYKDTSIDCKQLSDVYTNDKGDLVKSRCNICDKDSVTLNCDYPRHKNNKLVYLKKNASVIQRWYRLLSNV